MASHLASCHRINKAQDLASSAQHVYEAYATTERLGSAKRRSNACVKSESTAALDALRRPRFLSGNVNEGMKIYWQVRCSERVVSLSREVQTRDLYINTIIYILYIHIIIYDHIIHIYIYCMLLTSPYLPSSTVHALIPLLCPLRLPRVSLLVT